MFSRFRIPLLSFVLALAAPALAAAALDKPTPELAKLPSTHSYWDQAHTSKTEGEVTVGGQRIPYTAIAGTMILHNREGQPTGSIFYVAYLKRGVKASQRPITFLYNGGPGSSSVWLHMGAFGPMRVVTADHTPTQAAPYKLVKNQYSLLNVSDLVFVDAMGTGFSRIIGQGKPKQFYSIDGDAQEFAQLVTSFLSKYGRWNSPKYLFGESYGTTRSVVLANVLERQDRVDLNGVILLSAILTFNVSPDGANSNPGINLPYYLALPTYAATAWYHKVLPNRPVKLGPFLRKVEAFASGPYAQALAAGAALTPSQEKAIAEQLHAYTGLSTAYWVRARLRVSGPQFEHHLLLQKGDTIGRLDSRFEGPTLNPLAESAEYDPQGSAISSAYTAAFNNYVRKDLKFGMGHRYRITSAPVSERWSFEHTPLGGRHFARKSTPNMLPDLAAAMITNPDLKVMLNGGYFDLATPFYAAIYQMRQLPMPRRLQKNIEYAFYPSGHMVYVHVPSLKELHARVTAFILSTDNVH